jgi:chorismate mutase
MDSAQLHPQVDPVEAARAEIDQIDDALLDLIWRRQRVAETLAAAKPAAGLPIRPAREVQVLRRLTAAATGKLEPELVVEVWRGLMAANLRRQRLVDVAVGAGGSQDHLRYFDLARRHFGGRARIHRMEDARTALSKIAETDNLIGVVPWPNKTGTGMWWHVLTENRYSKLRIVAALPMRANASEAPDAALVGAGIPLEPAGGDMTFGIAFDRHYKVARALADAGIKGEETARTEEKVLIRLDGFVRADDPRLPLLHRAGLDQFRIVGSYARV